MSEKQPQATRADVLVEKLDDLLEEMADHARSTDAEHARETDDLSGGEPQVGEPPEEPTVLDDTLRALPLRVVRAVDLRQPPKNRWLIEGYVGEESCVVLGAAPKSFKTWLGISMAVAVASGRPLLGREVQRGRVLAYFAEDPEWVVRERLAKVCRAERLALEDLDSLMVRDASLMINVDADRRRLRETIAALRPRLVILDPFVRIVAGVDENNATQVSGVLGYLRAISREFGCAVVLAHHTRKSPGKGRAADSLRGSGDFFAWPDSVLSLRKLDDGAHALLQTEHRFAHARDPIVVRLADEDHNATHLVVGAGDTGSEVAPAEGLEPRVIAALAEADHPLTNERLRCVLQCKMAKLVEAVNRLEAEGRIERPNRRGWVLLDADQGGDGA